eukprot:scaffold2549_cov343-Prasinococcus_capsulatus_cf.AAC.5
MASSSTKSPATSGIATSVWASPQRSLLHHNSTTDARSAGHAALKGMQDHARRRLTHDEVGLASTWSAWVTVPRRWKSRVLHCAPLPAATFSSKVLIESNSAPITTHAMNEQAAHAQAVADKGGGVFVVVGTTRTRLAALAHLDVLAVLNAPAA